MPTTKRISSSNRRTKRSKPFGMGKKQNQKLVQSKIYKPLVVQRFPLPMRLQNTLRYVEEVQLSTDVSGYGAYVFSANGLYDVNVTGAGHQPMYFDQLTAIYNHYHVIASKCKASCVRSGSASEVNCALYIDDDVTVSAAALTTISERPGAVTWMAYPAQGNVSSRTKYFNAQYVYGGNVMDNDQLRGNAAGNPFEGSFYVVACAGPASSTVNFLVEIEFIVVWFEFKSMSPS